MKIGFYYPNYGLGNIDYSYPIEGNPGVGGTNYALVLLIFYLNKKYPDIELTVICQVDSKFPVNVKKYLRKDFQETLELADEERIDFLIIHKNDDYLNNLKYYKTKIIYWGHNYYFSDFAGFIANNKNIVANVFAGKQQYDRYIDHAICLKSTVIFNMIFDNRGAVNRKIDSRTVVYMGALIPAKGFLYMAKMWKAILKKVPDAKLKVIGTGRLYSRNAKLGPLGLADEEFERQFLPYISDENNKLLESVEFLGLLGKEKHEIFKNSKVGVINPSARTEIFSVSILEMACSELPVVTLNGNGFPDSIINGKTGYLCSSQRNIKNKIVKLLVDDELNYNLGKNAKLFIEQFSPEKITSQWVSLFNSLINNDTRMNYIGFSPPLLNNFKYIRIINRFLRNNLGFEFLPPLINIETSIYRLISRLFYNKVN